jgi:hypothetical protein
MKIIVLAGGGITLLSAILTGTPGSGHDLRADT